MNVAFYSNQLSIRGTEVALYNYADYNEKLLDNKSFIFSRPRTNLTSYAKFRNRFDVFLRDYDSAIFRKLFKRP